MLDFRLRERRPQPPHTEATVYTYQDFQFMMTDSEDQQDELMALTNILDEEVFATNAHDEEKGGRFYAHQTLPNNFSVSFDEGQVSTDIPNNTELHRVEYLPPLMLNFQLPANYPSQAPPMYTISCKWLTMLQITELCKKLDAIWEENFGMVILFSWTSFLQQEALDFLDVKSPLDLSHVVLNWKHKQDNNNEHDSHDARAVQDIGSQHLLRGVILEFNTYQQRQVFDKSLISCGVCLSEKYGFQCTQFYVCHHSFCKACMREYFCVQISDGNVIGIVCPHDKCQSDAHPCQIKELVPSEVFSRYDTLLLQTSLQTMVDIVYCPRPLCQSAVIFDRESGMAACPLCRFVFCPMCKLTYHGVSPCRIKKRDIGLLRDEYLNADDQKRAFLEKRYGKRVLTDILHEAFSEDWLKENSQQCPRCSTHIQKIDGCNKMTCTKCRSYFCWICNEPISRNNPYDHFNNADSKCVNQLFTGVEDEEEDEEWFEEIV